MDKEKLVLEYKRNYFNKPRRVRWPVYVYPDGEQQAGLPFGVHLPLEYILPKITKPAYVIRVIPK